MYKSDVEAMDAFVEKYQALNSEIGKVIVGQDEVVKQVLISIFSKGHCLLVGVPGLAKTLLVSTIADVLGLSFSRIQFTPDLMPSDIIGSEILDEARNFKFIKGPLFANIILADEINRTPPKTQAALLEAMQERSVTVAGKGHLLDEPFFVLATQNPIEQEGTYPLPEAQLDRFMFNIYIDYPSQSDERQIVMSTTSAYEPTLNSVTNSDEITRIQQVVRKVPVAESVVDFAVALTRLSRPRNPDAPDFIKNWVNWGAGTRASQYMILGAKARAVMHGRYHVTYDDVKSIAKPVLRHRILTNFNAEADEITSLEIIEKLLELNLEDH